MGVVNLIKTNFSFLLPQLLEPGSSSGTLDDGSIPALSYEEEEDVVVVGGNATNQVNLYRHSPAVTIIYCVACA